MPAVFKAIGNVVSGVAKVVGSALTLNLKGVGDGMNQIMGGSPREASARASNMLLDRSLNQFTSGYMMGGMNAMAQMQRRADTMAAFRLMSDLRA